MSDLSDLFDLPPARPLPEARVTAREQRIVQYAAETTRPPRTRKAARYAALLAGASVLALGGTAAAAYVAFKPATVPVADGLRCYTKATLDGGDENFYGTTIARARAADGTRSVEGAVESCRGLWDQGFLLPNQKQPARPEALRPDQPIPPLVACTLDNGLAAVFPGTAETCRELGLPRLAE
ncbi:hypothetical protein WEI85_36235 [Actinomycetes bacterium KLBMP 9797]